MGAIADLWRAGWGAVTVDELGNVTGGCYGTCSDEFPTSLRAELSGVIAVLRMAVMPITIDVDNKAVVQGSAAGRQLTVSAKNHAAALWK